LSPNRMGEKGVGAHRIWHKGLWRMVSHNIHQRFTPKILMMIGFVTTVKKWKIFNHFVVES
jgi:hypothetical protein